MGSFINLHAIRRYNQIIKINENPCVIGFEIYVETLFPALIPVLIDFVQPGGVEVIEIWLGRYHGVGGRALRKGAKLVFPNLVDTSNKIFLWKILAPIERTLFIWMMVDLVSDFAYNWESMAHRLAGCTPDLRHMEASSDEAVANDVPNQPYLWHVDSGDPFLCTVDGLFIPPFHTGSMSFAISSKPILGVQGVLDVKVVDGFTGQLIKDVGQVTPDQAAAGRGALYTGTFHGGTLGRWIKVKVNAPGGLPCATEGHASVTCAPLP